jgi:hypothetical protein
MLSPFASLPEAAARRELAEVGGGAEVRGSACRSREKWRERDRRIGGFVVYFAERTARIVVMCRTLAIW